MGATNLWTYGPKGAAASRISCDRDSGPCLKGQGFSTRGAEGFSKGFGPFALM